MTTFAQKKRIQGICFAAILFLICGGQYYCLVRFSDEKPDDFGKTYLIQPDGTRVDLAAPPRPATVPTPRWGRTLVSAIQLATATLLLINVVLICRLSFASATFRQFRLGYGTAILQIISAIACAATLALFQTLRFEIRPIFWEQGVFLQLLFALLLWNRLGFVRNERSQRTLDAMEIK